MSDISQRKAEHLDLCATDDVAFKGKTTLLEQVGLVHEALPEMAVSEVDLSTTFAGKQLSAPVIIAAMTGGTERAEAVNRGLAQVAQELGIGFGFGSMRPLLQDGIATGYQVRDVAPDALVLGNLGVVQAREASTQQIADLVGGTGCDALCVHLNPAMEVIQPEGDDDFRGGLDTLRRLVEGLDVPVIAKETGCGLSRRTAEQIATTGVRSVDVSGAGGTSWVGVETLRARARTRRLGELFWDWGIPTGGSVAQLSGLGLEISATGGLSHGLDVARAIALGATVGGLARRFLMAFNDGGMETARAAAEEVIDELLVACLLTGSRTPEALRAQPVVLGADLQRWVVASSPLARRTLGQARPSGNA
ncbi:MAG: type 2 isopentenyl-diphosphate Delta-isomerase [Myxococcales bacterium]|nr:type 2 isopentenyl-diphosphate Delta-isomerase [Myxococcales bacterium]